MRCHSIRGFLCVLLVSAVPLVSLAEGQTVDVRLGSYYFKPDTITVKAGQPVTLHVTNEASMIPHDLVIQAPEAGLDVKIAVGAGKSASAAFTPTRPGTYEVYCSKKPPFMKGHKDKGMTARLVVVE